MKIGFTSSFPVEVIYAAGHTPVDLNNIFVTGNAARWVEKAEFDGFPRNICAWIKGLYSVTLESGLDAVVGVTEGDCSNTHSLMSILKDQGLEVIPFAFPYSREKGLLAREIEHLEKYFRVTRSQTSQAKEWLDSIRADLIRLDEMTWKENLVSGEENHYWLVNSSDFNGDPDNYARRLRVFLQTARERQPFAWKFRFAYLGVPPIIPDLYSFLESCGIGVVFNEIQRQFSMPSLTEDIVDQYLAYTYPYTIYERLEDIRSEISRRKVQGILSYAQAFCHRQIDNIILKKYLQHPLMILEGDQPGELDARTRLRLESFRDILRF